MMQNTTAYPRTASIVALVGGTIITLSGVLFVAAASFILPNLDYAQFNIDVPQGLATSSIPHLVSGFVGLMGAFALVSGAVVLVSSVMLLAGSGSPRTWGVLILVFSILSLFGMGGFVVGAILGTVSGALLLRWKPQTA